MQHGTTTVTIYGQEYTVRSEGDAEYVRRIAAHVDERMREVARQSSQVTSLRVAILAALNITDELFRERDGTRSEADALRSRASQLAARLDAIVLEETASGKGSVAGAGQAGAEHIDDAPAVERADAPPGASGPQS